MEKPTQPADPRPNDEPYYIDEECDCGEALVYHEEETDWHDEFECPSCQDGIHLDVPESVKTDLLERAQNE